MRNHTSKTKITLAAVAGSFLYGTLGWLLGSGIEVINDGYMALVRGAKAGIRHVGTGLERLDKKFDNGLKKIEKLPGGKILTAPPKAAKKAQSWRAKVWNKILGRNEEDQEKWRKKYLEPPKEIIKYEEPKVNYGQPRIKITDSDNSEIDKGDFCASNASWIAATILGIYGATSWGLRSYKKQREKRERDLRARELELKLGA